MSGRVVRVIPITNFTFPATASTVTIDVAQHVDVSQFRYAALMARLHAFAIPASCSIKVQVWADGYTPEDPSKQFIDTSAVLGEVTFSPNETIFLKNAAVAPDKMGSQVTVRILAVQAGTSTFTATISADLALKD